MMREIDLSDLPDELSDEIIKRANETIEDYEFNANPVHVMPKSKIITLNGESDKIIRLYTELEQTVKSSLSDILEKNDEYTKNEIDKYKDSIEFKEAG